jgi:hypothetical protein
MDPGLSSDAHAVDGLDVRLARFRPLYARFVRISAHQTGFDDGRDF